jgi:hypothetical protein
MLRLYLFWRVVRDWMIHDLPKRCTLAGFQRLRIGSTFAVKRMLNSWLVARKFACLKNWDRTCSFLATEALREGSYDVRRPDMRASLTMILKRCTPLKSGRHAVSYLSCLWLVTLFLLAYWYRAVEVTVRFRLAVMPFLSLFCLSCGHCQGLQIRTHKTTVSGNMQSAYAYTQHAQTQTQTTI